MILRASFLRRELTQAIAIPLYAVVERGGERVVFVEDAGGRPAPAGAHRRRPRRPDRHRRRAASR